MNYRIRKNKKSSIKYCHIATILLGIFFISFTAFFTNALIPESSVMPLFGKHVIAYRISSVIAIVLMAIIGYTHIRKNFGEKEGFLFSFFTFFLPIMAQYAGTVSLYPIEMLLTTFMFLYAYRIYDGRAPGITFLLFGISSVFISYMHYYGFLLAIIVNLLLFFYVCCSYKNRKKDLMKLLIIMILELLAFVPLLMANEILKPLEEEIRYPETFYAILTMPLRGKITPMPVVITTIFYAYLISLLAQLKKKERTPVVWCIIIITSLIFITWLISVMTGCIVLSSNCFMICSGIFIFAITYLMATDTKQWRVALICLSLMVISCLNVISLAQEKQETTNFKTSGITAQKILK